jgi:hypothetical protein
MRFGEHPKASTYFVLPEINPCLLLTAAKHDETSS